jgi:hypothetical protein
VDTRAAELLAEIERDLLGGEVRTTALLQKCIVLGGRAGSEKLRDWASRELNGYGDEDEVPGYRSIGAVIQADVSTGNRLYKGHVISSIRLPKIARDAGVDENVTFKQGIGEIEDLAGRGDKAVTVTRPGAAIIAEEIDRLSGNPFQQTHSLYWSMSSSAVRGIVERVRTALAEFVGELVAHLPADGSGPAAEAVDRAVTVVLTGDRASVNYNSVATQGDVAISTAEVGDVKMGDTFSNITNSNIVNRSLVTSSMNALQQSGYNESAQALEQLASLVEESGDREAGECLDNFNEELSRDQPRKAILRAMWERIVVLLPLAGSTATIATGIANLIN